MPEETVRDGLITLLREHHGDEIVERAEGDEPIFAAHGSGHWCDGKLDSLDRMELVMAAEDRFHVEIPDVVAIGFTRLDQVVSYIEIMKRPPTHGAH